MQLREVQGPPRPLLEQQITLLPYPILPGRGAGRSIGTRRGTHGRCDRRALRHGRAICAGHGSPGEPSSRQCQPRRPNLSVVAVPHSKGGSPTGILRCST